MSAELEGKLIKAKIELMTRSAFISTIALSAKHTITDSIPTAAVHKIHIMYNPSFIEKLTIPQLAAVIAHECWHIAFQHSARRGERIFLLWNIAADYVINHLLTKAGFQLPEDCLLNKEYDEEWSTDAVYEDLLKNAEQIENKMVDLSEDEGAGGMELDSEVTQTIVRARTQSQMSNENIGTLPGEISCK